MNWYMTENRGNLNIEHCNIFVFIIRTLIIIKFSPVRLGESIGLDQSVLIAVQNESMDMLDEPGSLLSIVEVK